MTAHSITYSIPEECSICGVIKINYEKPDSGRGSYYSSDKFVEHLRLKHKLTLYEYLKSINFKVPLCSCGCKEQVKFGCAREIIFRNCIKGHVVWNKGLTKKDDKRLKNISRKMRGKLNPLYGIKPWNKGLTAKEDHRLREIGDKRRGYICSTEVRLKQSKSAKKRKIHGMQGKTHSKKTRKRLREHAIRQLKHNTLGCGKTSIEVYMEEYFNKCDIINQYNYQYGYYLYDFEIEMEGDYILIEVHGDFWHGNPKVYKRKNLRTVQLRNIERDKSKFARANKSVKHLGMIVIWELDIALDTWRKKFWQDYQRL